MKLHQSTFVPSTKPTSISPEEPTIPTKTTSPKITTAQAQQVYGALATSTTRARRAPIRPVAGPLAETTAKAMPTSIDELAPGSPVLTVLHNKQRPEGVHYHSIIGVTAESHNPIEEWLTGVDAHVPGDGVVPYKSAHLSDVDSEVIVPAEHTLVHHHPLAILELRRILLEHLKEK